MKNVIALIIQDITKVHRNVINAMNIVKNVQQQKIIVIYAKKDQIEVQFLFVIVKEDQKSVIL